MLLVMSPHKGYGVDYELISNTSLFMLSLALGLEESLMLSL